MMKPASHIAHTGIPFKHTLLVGLLLLASTACSSGDIAGARRLLQGIPAEMIDHIIESDDSTLVRYGREAGFVVVSDANKILDHRIYNLYADGRNDEAAALLTYTKRIACILASEYQYSWYLDRLYYIENLPPDIRTELMRKELEFYSVRSQVDLSASQKLDTYSRLLDFFEKHQDVEFIALCEYEISYAYHALGDEKAQQKYLRSSYSNFAKCGLHEMTAPVLTELGGYHEGIGQIDSMVYYYEQAKALAKRSRLPLETAQIASLYSAHYARNGRLSLAYDLLAEAIEICREFKGEYEELRYIVETMSFQAELNCWEIVERLLERARILQSKYKDDPEKYFELYSLQIDRLEGRLKMATGNVEDADTFFRKTKLAIENLNMPYTKEPETATLFYYWSQGLLEIGHADEALRIIRRGLRLSRESQLTELAARFALLSADASYRLGDLTAAGRAVEQFDSIAADIEEEMHCESIKRDALLGELALADGDRERAKNTLESGLNRMKRFVSSRDAGVQSYLKIGECDELRRLMHEMTAHDPLMGYGAELAWRDFHRLLGRTSHGYSASPAVDATGRADPFLSAFDDRISLSSLRILGEAGRNRIAGLGAVHCVYAIIGNQILRWTVTEEDLRCDTLDVSADEAKKFMNATWSMMAPLHAESNTVSSKKLEENLHRLARIFLPPPVMQQTDESADNLLLITADDFLGRIPFEAFDVGGGQEYIPLLMKRDVAYLSRLSAADGRANAHPGIILVNEKLSQEHRMRYPFQQPLPQALIEAETMAALEPNGTLLSGASATKSKLLSMWEKAPFVYFVTHTLRDPQVPYLMLIPLAAPEGPAAPDASYLDFSDIRGADFRRCNLVVLSGCSSGAPYVNERNSAPSLGDAFLDAGAAAVVQTFWDVRDEDAKQLMTLFIPAWRSGASTSIRALCDARRTMIRRSNGIQHLSRWAPFFIKLGGL